MIYHITSKKNWDNALEKGYYEAESLLTEGFIHASTNNQVAGVLERYYKGQTGLLKLHIDENKLRVPLKYEIAPSVYELFPHIYGRLNIDAVHIAEPIPNP
jgi:uncharacterized protein (DUF952 family)